MGARTRWRRPAGSPPANLIRHPFGSRSRGATALQRRTLRQLDPGGGAVRACLRVLTVLFLLAACGARDERPELCVFAAVSVRDALAEIVPAFEIEHGARVTTAFGASGDLARQILAGAPADVFLSADEAEMDRLEAAGRLVPCTRADLVANVLVVIEPSGHGTFREPFDPSQLADHRVDRLSIGDPGTVPAGRYARAWLVGHGLWDAVSQRLVPAVDARAALAAVEAGAAAGIVYATDAARSKRVRVVHVVTDGPAITYPVGALARPGQESLAVTFLAHLASPASSAAFERHGFRAPGETR